LTRTLPAINLGGERIAFNTFSLPRALADNDAETFSQAFALDFGRCAVCEPCGYGNRANELPVLDPNGRGTVIRTERLIMRFCTEVRRDLVCPGVPAERSVRHKENTVPPACLEFCVGRKIRQEFAIAVVDVDLYGISDNVLRYRRVKTNLSDPTVKHSSGNSVHSKCHWLARINVPNIRFVDRDPRLNTS
jgi:hypothetical protein